MRFQVAVNVADFNINFKLKTANLFVNDTSQNCKAIIYFSYFILTGLAHSLYFQGLICGWISGWLELFFFFFFLQDWERQHFPPGLSIRYRLADADVPVSLKILGLSFWHEGRSHLACLNISCTLSKSNVSGVARATLLHRIFFIYPLQSYIRFEPFYLFVLFSGREIL